MAKLERGISGDTWGPTIPFLEGSSDSEYSDSWVRAVRYVRGVPDEGMYQRQ